MTAYLDHAATAGLLPVALVAYTAAAEVVGNPSSLHSAGRAARRIVEDARESIAANLGAHPTELVFTSGGTEANNLAIKGIYWAQTARHPSRRGLAVSALEHHSVLEPARWLARHGAELIILPVTEVGVVPLTALEKAATQLDEIALVSIMLASNEIGTIQPIQQLAELAHSYGIPFHTDAVAALGQIPISFADLGVDALSVAAHKIGGPLGVGALLIKRELPIEPLLHGGEQERGLRSGTIDVPGVAAFAAALSAATANLETIAAHTSQLRDQLIAGVFATIPNVVPSGPIPDQLTAEIDSGWLSSSAAAAVSSLRSPVDSPAGWLSSRAEAAVETPSGTESLPDSPSTPTIARLPANASFVFPGADPDALLFGLDNAGFAASIGAACAAGVARPSEALLACGFSEADAKSSLRFTLGPATSSDDITQLLSVLPRIVAAARM